MDLNSVLKNSTLSTLNICLLLTDRQLTFKQTDNPCPLLASVPLFNPEGRLSHPSHPDNRDNFSLLDSWSLIAMISLGLKLTNLQRTGQMLVWCTTEEQAILMLFWTSSHKTTAQHHSSINLFYYQYWSIFLSIPNISKLWYDWLL